MKKVFAIFLIFVLIFCGSCFYAYIYFTSPVGGSDHIRFSISKGDSVISVGKRLQNLNIIKNAYAFLIYTKLTSRDKKIQSGTFELTSTMDLSTIVSELTKNGHEDIWITLIEGWRIEEISKYLQETAGFDPKIFEAKTKHLQGKLFPDTYSFPKSYSVDEVISMILANFEKKISKAKENSLQDLEDEKIIILASLLEREAKTVKSKQIIAGIIINRLGIGMPLQIDATVQYAKDSKVPQPERFWKPILSSDLSINSPYNTYKNLDLPPVAICNPGYDSLYAAYHPENSDYYFYITGKDGQMYYAKTLEEHNRNISMYL